MSAKLHIGVHVQLATQKSGVNIGMHAQWQTNRLHQTKIYITQANFCQDY